MIRGSLEWYEEMWNSMRMRPEFDLKIRVATIKVLDGKPRYDYVAAETGVPWYFTGLIHWREAVCDFRGVLHNGEKIIGTNKKTKLVPKGRGPFQTWEEAAIDVLMLQKLHINYDWSIPNMLFLFERYNGTGYLRYHPEQNSPYIWGYTYHTQTHGRYASDGKYDKNALANTYSGVAPILRELFLMGVI